MKKRDLATLAMLGISAGLIVSGCQKQGGPGGNKGQMGYKGSADERMSSDMQSYYNSLSPDAQQKFMQLDAQHKMMAVEMAQQTCSGQNKCASMGGCATSQHQCAGKNGCQGQGGAPVRDPNKAVEVQYNNQMLQRQKSNGGMRNQNTPAQGNYNYQQGGSSGWSGRGY
jgi:hypothetical protein